MRGISGGRHIAFIVNRIRALCPGVFGDPRMRLVLRIIAPCAGILIVLTLLLPRPLFDVPYSKVLYSGGGELLGARIAADQQWRFPGSGKLPDKYRCALLQYEDKRFYCHFGIDPVALVRAIADNVRGKRIVSGASTISMQVIRLALGQNRRSIVQKIYETLLSIGLESRYSKAEILSLYAAHAPFGGNIVGIKAASWRYFGREPGDLSWAESATLAILPNNPSLIHPGRNRDILKNKRDNLLRRLHKSGRLSDIDLELSLSEDLPREPLALPKSAPRFLDALAAANPGESLFESTIDSSVQERVNEIVQKHHETLKLKGVYNIAAIVIDNESCSVSAYVGNIPQAREEGDDPLFNERGYDIDLIRRPRSTGSILKPLLYAAMLCDGEITPETLIRDLPVQYDGFMPENFSRTYSGVVPAKAALARSLNVPAIVMLKDLGYQRFYAMLKSAGMTTLFRTADEYGLTLVIGGAEGTLWEIASIYSYLARIAMDLDCREISALKKQKGAEIRVRGISPGGAYLTLEALLEVERPGVENYWRSFAYAQKIAWKTGTSLGHRDAWSVGVSKKYTVGVWCGNSDGEGRPGMTGLVAAAPVMFEIFSSLPRSSWFTPPYHDMKSVEVCSRSGYLAGDLCERTSVLVPRSNNFDRVCPYHQLIHTDSNCEYRVSGDCMPESEMRHIAWFVLPPVEEYYYLKNSTDYKKMPPLREECAKNGAVKSQTMSLIYPPKNTSIYIPVGVSGEKSRVILKAAHTDTRAVIYWHLDDTYSGRTENFHELAVQPSPGRHRLILVDNNGYTIEQTLTVIGTEER